MEEFMPTAFHTDAPTAGLEEVVQTGQALLASAEALESRAEFVRFVGALRRYLADYAPTFDTLRLGDYLAALGKVAGTRVDEWELESPDTATWSLFGTVLAGACFEADPSPRPIRIPERH